MTRVYQPGDFASLADDEELSELKWALLDVDGTLAEPLWTPDNPTKDIGPPIPKNIAKALKLYYAGYKLTVWSSRPWSDYLRVERWCERNKLPVRRILLGKPLGGVYCDDRAVNADAESW